MGVARATRRAIHRRGGPGDERAGLPASSPARSGADSAPNPGSSGRAAVAIPGPRATRRGEGERRAGGEARADADEPSDGPGVARVETAAGGPRREVEMMRRARGGRGEVLARARSTWCEKTRTRAARQVSVPQRARPRPRSRPPSPVSRGRGPPRLDAHRGASPRAPPSSSMGAASASRVASRVATLADASAALRSGACTARDLLASAIARR